MERSVADDLLCSDDDILKLLSHFVKSSHRVKNSDIKGETVMELCSLLFSRDYKFTIVPNLSGELCSHYPMKLVITEFEKSGQDQQADEHYESTHIQHEIFQMMKSARCARCRSRFVVPVIFFEGKHICRSATLSGAAEMFGRSTTDYFMSNQNSTFTQGNSDIGKSDMFDRFRGNDIQLLKYFDVGFICDLMVEKKKTKFGLPLTSSEKVDKENRYADFTILGMPYPGCEFFKEWKDNFYCGESLVYDWGAALNDSSLDLPSTPLVNELGIDWHRYKDWNLTTLTQNYMKLLLKLIKEASTGLLIHCISGWDRTPLFVSLLRLSLWADGLIHTSLRPPEMLYLTLGYDWYLFGHELPDRLNNDEEVMFFCFKVLKEIASESFSLLSRPQYSGVGQNPSSPLLRGCSPQTRAQTTSSSSPQQQQQQQHGQQQQQQQQQQPHHQQQQLQNQIRVDSDSNLGIQGVLLADELMSFPHKGSTSSLNSLGSMEGPGEPCHFTVGDDIQEEGRGSEEAGGGAGGRGGGGGGERMRSKRPSIPNRHSLSPPNPHVRHSSPINVITTDTTTTNHNNNNHLNKQHPPHQHHHHHNTTAATTTSPSSSSSSSSTTAGCKRGGNRRKSSITDVAAGSASVTGGAHYQQQALSIQSNHFMNSPVGREMSSPMCVPGRPASSSDPPPSVGSMSVGSWQIIPSVDNLRSMDSNHSPSNSSNDKSSHVSFGQDTYEHNQNSLRYQRLDAVSRMFESAYIRAVPSAHLRTSSVGAGITSLFDRFAEQVGFRGGGGGGGLGSNQNSTGSRRGV